MIKLSDISTKLTDLDEKRISLLEEKLDLEERIERIYDIGVTPSAEHFENLLSINNKIATIDLKLSEIKRLLKVLEDIQNQICQNINDILAI